MSCTITDAVAALDLVLDVVGRGLLGSANHGNGVCGGAIGAGVFDTMGHPCTLGYQDALVGGA